MAVFDPIEKYHAITQSAFCQQAHDYLLHRAFALLNESAFARLPSLRTCYG
jgi:hypothetical protein